MGNWREGVFFIASIISVLILLFSGQNGAYYSPSIADNLEVSTLGNKFDNEQGILSCPGEHRKDVIGYGVEIIKLADEVSREECLTLYAGAHQEIKTNSLRVAKNRAIEACKDSIPKFDFTCGNTPCIDCQKTIGTTSCDDVHDNKIEAVSLAHAGGKGLCNMKSSASAWGKISISCASGVCAG